MKILVFGYHQIGYLCLQELLKTKENVIGLFTYKADPKENIWFKTPDLLAKKYKIPIYYDADLNSDKIKQLITQKLQPDLIFSFYFREKIPTYIIEYPKLRAFNLHGSYLPYYRGAAPLNWALVNGEKFTGASIHYLSDQFDTGAILDRTKIKITKDDDINSLYAKFHTVGLEIFRKNLKKIKSGKINTIEQDSSNATYFPKRKPEDGLIRWDSQTSEQIYNLIRAVTYPYPGAFTYFQMLKFIFWRAKVVESKKWHLPIRMGIYDHKNKTLRIGCSDGKILEVTDFSVMQNNKEINLPKNLKLLKFVR
jgi:methionyl-tRNA formyltransferase